MSPQDAHHKLDFINRLPIELLDRIFRYFFASLKGYDLFLSSFTLSQVNQHWRRLCLGSPEYWTYSMHRRGSTNFDRRRIALRLERSAGIPVDMDLEWGNDSEAEALSQMVIHLAPRLRTVSLHGPITPSIVATIITHHLDDLKTFPVLKDATFRLNKSAWDHSDHPILPDNPDCPRLRRILIWNHKASPCVLPSYASLRVLVVKNNIVSVGMLGLLFGGMPQIKELQLLDAYAADPFETVPTIAAPHLRRFCMVPDMTRLHDPNTRCLAVMIIRALEAPKLRELLYGFMDSPTNTVSVVQGVEGWAARFPKLDMVGFWDVSLEDDDLKRTLLLTFPKIRTLRFRSRLELRWGVADIMRLLGDLVESGKLRRLKVVDFHRADFGLIHEGLRGRKTRLPLRVRIHREGLTVVGSDADVIARVREIVELEVYGDKEGKEWIY
ncbi:hypothetical protein FRB99_000003 [Tulasnella sp. 403]|nr:hypothetical protein FRB99_000003 [Tulasnella sp. 403]